MFGRILEVLLQVYFSPLFLSVCVFGNLVKEKESCCQQTFLYYPKMYMLTCNTYFVSLLFKALYYSFRKYTSINIDHFFSFLCVCVRAWAHAYIKNNRNGRPQEQQQ